MRRQKGITLIITLLFLLVVTLVTVASVSSSTTNLRVTGNMVVRQEAVAAAQAVIEQTLSSTMFATDPDAVAAGEYPIDIDGDGTSDYAPVLSPAPECRRARVLRTTELDPDRAEDVACLTSGTVTHGGIESAGASASAGASMCATTAWNIRATAEDPRTGTEVAVNQGVGVRVAATDATNFCEE